MVASLVAAAAAAVDDDADSAKLEILMVRNDISNSLFGTVLPLLRTL